MKILLSFFLYRLLLIKYRFLVWILNKIKSKSRLNSSHSFQSLCHKYLLWWTISMWIRAQFSSESHRLNSKKCWFIIRLQWSGGWIQHSQTLWQSLWSTSPFVWNIKNNLPNIGFLIKIQVLIAFFPCQIKALVRFQANLRFLKVPLGAWLPNTKCYVVMNYWSIKSQYLCSEVKGDIKNICTKF